MADTLGAENPLRYRGYVYDVETGLYYLQSRYYDPGMGRFINADNYPSTGQGLLGNNMFAYCNNNPVVSCDPTGELGMVALCAIGAIAGGLVDYAGQVIQNYHRGKTGTEMWVDVNWGEVAGSTFSGAVSTIPGGAVAEVVDIVGSNVIEHSVNALVTNTKIDLHSVGNAIADDVITSAFLPEILPDVKVPQFIRDIKKEARAAGIKGTKKLQAYLNFKQVTGILINTFNSSTSSLITDRCF